MHVTEIQTAVDEILADMLARGLRQPKCEATIEARNTPSIYVRWEVDGLVGGKYEFLRGETIEEAIDEGRKFIASIPPKAERDHAEFARMLADAIDKGRDIGIEVDFLNPLTETMKRLSENILTYQPAEDLIDA